MRESLEDLKAECGRLRSVNIDLTECNHVFTKEWPTLKAEIHRQRNLIKSVATHSKIAADALEKIMELLNAL